MAYGLSVGQEGGISIQFKANNTSGAGHEDNSEYLWMFCDTNDKVGEYRAEIVNNSIFVALWSDKGGANGTGGYVVNTGDNGQSIPFTDTTSWHTLDLAWKNGSPTLLTLDGVVKQSITNIGTLDSFTSGANWSTLGAVATTPPRSFFDGQMQNVEIRNTYAAPTPEPSSIVMLGVGLASLLAYAWRKRK